jgi:hypothetical protein
VGVGAAGRAGAGIEGRAEVGRAGGWLDLTGIAGRPGAGTGRGAPAPVDAGLITTGVAGRLGGPLGRGTAGVVVAAPGGAGVGRNGGALGLLTAALARPLAARG